MGFPTVIVASMRITGERSNECHCDVQLDVIALPNNTLVVAYDDSIAKRSPLRLATSTDGGLSWTRAALIEDDPEGSFHYPALVYDAKKVRAALARFTLGKSWTSESPRVYAALARLPDACHVRILTITLCPRAHSHALSRCGMAKASTDAQPRC